MPDEREKPFQGLLLVRCRAVVQIGGGFRLFERDKRKVVFTLAADMRGGGVMGDAIDPGP